MAATMKLTRLEGKLFLRDPIALFFGLVFPAGKGRKQAPAPLHRFCSWASSFNSRSAISMANRALFRIRRRRMIDW